MALSILETGQVFHAILYLRLIIVRTHGSYFAHSHIQRHVNLEDY
jgi:hypothetical protein